MFIQLSVLTVCKPTDGKGEKTTDYFKRIINVSHVMDVMDDPKMENVIHITMSNGGKLLADGTIDKFKKLVKKAKENL